MKSLSFSAALLVLLASCQPSSDKQASTETLTQQKKTIIPTENRRAENETIARNVYSAAAAKRMSPKGRQFSKFLQGFPEISLPLFLDGKTSKSINDKSYISYEYERFIPEMAGERFSREVGKEFYYLAKVSETEDYSTVVYAVKNVIMGDNAPYGYVLASYNSRGKLIDKLVAGGQIEMEDLLCEGNILPDLAIEIKAFRQKWAKDPKKEGYFDNKRVGMTLKKTNHYRIASNGHFEAATQLLSMK